jgi:hypothetical protein
MITIPSFSILKEPKCFYIRKDIDINDFVRYFK